MYLKDVKLLKKRSPKDIDILEVIVDILAKNGSAGLAKKHRAHRLSGSYNNYCECHVKPVCC